MKCPTCNGSGEVEAPSKMADFKAGDRVIHARFDDVGTVVGIKSGGLLVEFDEFNGLYDAAWFRHYPTMLRHAK